MAIPRGTFVRIHYTGRIKDTGEIFDTTREDIAREAGIYDENATYGPVDVVVGAGHVLKGLDEALEQMSIGEKREVEIPPEKGFGKRDPRLIQTFSMRDFRREKITPYPGMRVNIDGRIGVVRSVTGGRVVVDFNHELAGKTLVYEVEVLGKLEGVEDKLRALLKLRFGRRVGEKFDIEILEDRTAIIRVPDEVKLSGDSLYRKAALVSDVREFMKDEIRRIEFVETWEIEEEAAKEKEEKEAGERAGESEESEGEKLEKSSS